METNGLIMSAVLGVLVGGWGIFLFRFTSKMKVD